MKAAGVLAAAIAMLILAVLAAVSAEWAVSALALGVSGLYFKAAGLL